MSIEKEKMIVGELYCLVDEMLFCDCLCVCQFIY